MRTATTIRKIKHVTTGLISPKKSQQVRAFTAFMKAKQEEKGAHAAEDALHTREAAIEKVRALTREETTSGLPTLVRARDAEEARVKNELRFQNARALRTKMGLLKDLRPGIPFVFQSVSGSTYMGTFISFNKKTALILYTPRGKTTTEKLRLARLAKRVA